jgi:hypothetical protein
MARGGIVTKPTNALLGDDGPEAVVPLSGTPGAKVSPAILPGARPPIPGAPVARAAALAALARRPPLARTAPVAPGGPPPVPARPLPGPGMQYRPRPR